MGGGSLAYYHMHLSVDAGEHVITTSDESMYGRWGKCHQDGIGELLRYQLKEALVLIQSI